MSASESTRPLVTIGLAVRNGEKYVRRALDSLVGQDYPNVRILISDNASTDDTEAICREFAARDPRITYVRQQQNLGAFGNFKFVLDEAPGPYFMWAADDDLWMPRFVSALVDELEAHPEAGLAMSAIERVRESGGRFDLVKFGPDRNPNTLSHSWNALDMARGVGTVLYLYGLFRIEYLRRAFAHFAAVYGGDRLLLMQMALSTRIRYVDEVLHVRQVADTPINLRYADENDPEYGGDALAAFQPIVHAGPYLLRSPIIPLHRKLVVPLIVVRLAASGFLWQGLYSLGFLAGRRLLGRRRFDAARRRMRRAAGR